MDIGDYDLRAQTITADSLTANRLVFAGTNGVLTDDSDLTFSTDTLTATKIGAFEAAGSINFASQAMTNVNIDSGAIDATIIGANSARAGTFTTLTANADQISSKLGVNIVGDTTDEITLNIKGVGSQTVNLLNVDKVMEPINYL